jgi:hypothetical protein
MRQAKRGTTIVLLVRISGELARLIKTVIARLRLAEAAIILARATNSSLRVIRANAAETAVDGTRR